MDPLIGLTIALAFAALCGGAAVHQGLGWSEWPGILRNYRLLPEAWVPVVAVVLPLLEALTSLALLWPRSRVLGASTAAVLLVVFALAMGINLGRGRTHIDCGCFGVRLRTGLSRWMVVRNVLLAALVLALLVPPAPRPLSMWDWIVALISVASLAFLYPALNLLLDSRAAWRRASDAALEA
jgi:hypothetical protein